LRQPRIERQKILAFFIVELDFLHDELDDIGDKFGIVFVRVRRQELHDPAQMALRVIAAAKEFRL
jgi:hypothetical protein